MGGPKHYPGQWADVYGTIDVASGLAGLTQEALRDVGVSISWFSTRPGGPTVQANLGYIWTDCHQLIESAGSDLEYPSA